ncbi:Oxidoreductase, short chain dehydrogenase/reductase family protein [Propionibacterium freudenreichii]|nr:Oxidoreductase, short chain dehydrogenase/reductase family protein [Propionibacterium freudenreichii]
MTPHNCPVRDVPGQSERRLRARVVGNHQLHPGVGQLVDLGLRGARVEHHMVELGEVGELEQGAPVELGVVEQQHPHLGGFQHGALHLNHLLVGVEAGQVGDARGRQEADVGVHGAHILHDGGAHQRVRPGLVFAAGDEQLRRTVLGHLIGHQQRVGHHRHRRQVGQGTQQPHRRRGIVEHDRAARGDQLAGLGRHPLLFLGALFHPELGVGLVQAAGDRHHLAAVALQHAALLERGDVAVDRHGRDAGERGKVLHADGALLDHHLGDGELAFLLAFQMALLDTVVRTADAHCRVAPQCSSLESPADAGRVSAAASVRPGCRLWAQAIQGTQPDFGRAGVTGPTSHHPWWARATSPAMPSICT